MMLVSPQNQIPRHAAQRRRSDEEVHVDSRVVHAIDTRAHRITIAQTGQHGEEDDDQRLRHQPSDAQPIAPSEEEVVRLLVAEAKQPSKSCLVPSGCSGGNQN